MLIPSKSHFINCRQFCTKPRSINKQMLTKCQIKRLQILHACEKCTNKDFFGQNLNQKYSNYWRTRSVSWWNEWWWLVILGSNITRSDAYWRKEKRQLSIFCWSMGACVIRSTSRAKWNATCSRSTTSSVVLNPTLFDEIFFVESLCMFDLFNLPSTPLTNIYLNSLRQFAPKVKTIEFTIQTLIFPRILAVCV